MYHSNAINSKRQAALAQRGWEFGRFGPLQGMLQCAEGQLASKAFLPYTEFHSALPFVQGSFFHPSEERCSCVACGSVTEQNMFEHNDTWRTYVLRCKRGARRTATSPPARAARQPFVLASALQRPPLRSVVVQCASGAARRRAGRRAQVPQTAVHS